MPMTYRKKVIILAMSLLSMSFAVNSVVAKGAGSEMLRAKSIVRGTFGAGVSEDPSADGSTTNLSPVQSPVVQSPFVQSPVQSPVVQSPVVQSPVSPSPVSPSSVDPSPVVNSPFVDLMNEVTDSLEAFKQIILSSSFLFMRTFDERQRNEALQSLETMMSEIKMMESILDAVSKYRDTKKQFVDDAVQLGSELIQSALQPIIDCISEPNARNPLAKYEFFSKSKPSYLDSCQLADLLIGFQIDNYVKMVDVSFIEVLNVMRNYLYTRFLQNLSVHSTPMALLSVASTPHGAAIASKILTLQPHGSRLASQLM